MTFIHFFIETFLLLIIAGGVWSVARDINYIVRCLKEDRNED